MQGGDDQAAVGAPRNGVGLRGRNESDELVSLQVPDAEAVLLRLGQDALAVRAEQGQVRASWTAECRDEIAGFRIPNVDPVRIDRDQRKMSSIWAEAKS